MSPAVVPADRAGRSFLGRLDPRTKILALAAVAAASLAADRWTSLAALSLLSLLAAAMAGMSPGHAWRALRRFGWLLALTVLIQALWAPGGAAGAPGGGWTLSLTGAGLEAGGKFLVKLAVMIVGAAAVSFATTPGRLGEGLGRLLAPLRRAGLSPESMSLAFSIGLQFLPILAREAGEVKRAQASRGLPHFSGNPLARLAALQALWIPVVVRSVRRADGLALAMVMRAYREGGARTSLNPLAFGRRDWAAAAVSALLLLASAAPYVNFLQHQAR